MILVRFSGGLGNQIFQYGLYLEIKKRYPDAEVKGDVFTYIYQDAHYGFELDRIFQLSERGLLKLADRKDYYMATGTLAPTKLAPSGSFREKLFAYTNARLRERQDKLGNKLRIQEEPAGFIATNEIRSDRWSCIKKQLYSLNVKKDWYIDGYWQSTEYFEDSLADLINSLEFPQVEDDENKRIIEMIQKSESVSIHIRRGDYVNTIYDVVEMDYYRNAVEDIRNRLSEDDKIPAFFIFSDDPEYVKSNFGWLGEYRLIDINSGRNSFKDLQLMSLCKHQITANSSFSIWGGYLNRNPNKYVYYPEKYTVSLLNVEKNEPGWIKICQR